MAFQGSATLGLRFESSRAKVIRNQEVAHDIIYGSH